MKKAPKILLIVLAVLAVLAVGLGFGVHYYLKSHSPRQVIVTRHSPNIYVEELSYFDGLDKIYGKVYKPQDTLGAKPLIIFCAGIGTNSDVWDETCRMAARKGMVAYTFDFRGGFPGSRSSGNPLDMSVKSERKDLEFVLKRLRREPFVDKDHVYLMGHSQGGLIAALVGAGYRKEVAGMVLLAPAFNIPEMCDRKYPRLRDIPDSTFFVNMFVGKEYFKEGKALDPYKWLHRYSGDVLIMHGTDDTLVPIEYSELAAQEFQNAELIRFEGTQHRFEGSDGKRMREQLDKYLDRQFSKQ